MLALAHQAIPDTIKYSIMHMTIQAKIQQTFETYMTLEWSTF